MDHLLSKEKASVEILFSFEWTSLRETQEEIIENWIIEKRKREDRDKKIIEVFLEKVERKLREFNTETVSKKEIVIKTPNR